MTVFLKRFVTLPLVLVLTLVLTGCGDKEVPNEDNKDKTEYHGATSGADDSLKNITASNYKKVAKEVFGIEINDHTGWTLEEVKSPNGINNLNIDYIVNNGEDGKTIIEGYFNKCSALGNVYSYGFNDDYTAMVKGNKYTDFASFAEKDLTNVYELYQAMWLYEYNGKSIQLGIDIDVDSAGFSFVLLG